MRLPESISTALKPLFDEVPLEQAMGELVVTQGARPDRVSLVERLLEHPAIRGKETLAAGLWLYIDELDRSHTISQGISSATGSFWHGIMHRREGDFGNSHYWFNRTGYHPAMDSIPGYEAHRFVDEVQAHHRKAPSKLIKMQRAEWQALFEWCASRLS